MTSMPASRKARAIIFAPRSWPSSPGFAISTRIFFSIIRSYHCASGFAKQGRSVCQTVATARVGELEVTVPLWFDMFDEHDILTARLSDNLQEISSRHGPESKVALTVSGRPAYSGFPDSIQNVFESEAVFCIREVVVSSQSRASRIVCALGGKDVSVCLFFLLVLLLQVSERSRKAFLLLVSQVI